jgi:hypothetical protein
MGGARRWIVIVVLANPIFRFLSRVVFGHHATMDALLKRVARTFNEKPSLSGK